MMDTVSYQHSISRKAIEQQLERIFIDPLFSESKILKRFLSFIVNETLEGHANRLKEYTIAVKVLDKPLTFKPQENGIVRIHAGRLRRALNHFYEKEGLMDEVQISVPKGKYVPLIRDRNSRQNYSTTRTSQEPDLIQIPNQTIVAVLPFLCPNDNRQVQTLVDGLCWKLTEVLMQQHDVTVINYQAAKSISQQYADFKDLSSATGANYIITGNTQYTNGILRVGVQIVKASNCVQIWSSHYERKLTKSNLFKLEDEISSLVSSAIRELPQFSKSKTYMSLGLAAI